MSKRKEKKPVEVIKEWAAKGKNRFCVDCNVEKTDWASVNIGVFLCIDCAGVHRDVGVEYSAVRSITLDRNCWKDKEKMKVMMDVGNEKATAIYEHSCPIYHLQPKQPYSNRSLVREHWIRAKYVRKQFSETDKITALLKRLNAKAGGSTASGGQNLESKGAADDEDEAASDSDTDVEDNKAEGDAKELVLGDIEGVSPAVFAMPGTCFRGFLLKENSKQVRQRRWFVLRGRYLSYYKDPTDSIPRGIIDIRHVAVQLPGTLDDHPPNTFEVLTTQDLKKKQGESVRVYRLTAEDEEGMLLWMHTLRRCALYYAKVAPSEGEDKTAQAVINESKGQGDKDKGGGTKYEDLKKAGIDHQGFLAKQGGKRKNWNERFFVLSEDRLHYFKIDKKCDQFMKQGLPDREGGGKNEPFPELESVGSVDLKQSEIIAVESGLLKKQANPLCIVRCGRQFYIGCDSSDTCKAWSKVLTATTHRLNKRRVIDFSTRGWEGEYVQNWSLNDQKYVGWTDLFIQQQ